MEMIQVTDNPTKDKTVEIKLPIEDDDKWHNF